MGHLANDEFFARLTDLFDSRKDKDHGSILLTQKRLTYDQTLPETTSNDVFPDLHPPRPMPILVRATNTKSKEQRKERQKIKLSTIVEAHDLPGFFERYAQVCKMGMIALKPRDRSKRKGKAKKKKGGVAAAS
ncbi:signal recognition particle 14kD protein [Xylariaceae sp. FL0016]|nr:signal recognition particle 14kD protein [Xylariaceae sp. FL0016]